MLAIGRLHIEVAVERDVVGRIREEAVHLLDEVDVVQTAVLLLHVYAVVHAPLGDRERFAMLPREPAPKRQAMIAVQYLVIPNFPAARLDFHRARFYRPWIGVLHP